MKAKQSAVFAAACSLALSLLLVPEAGISRGQLRRYAPELCSAGKTAREEYELLPGTELQQTVTALHGEKPGKPFISWLGCTVTSRPPGRPGIF